MGLGSCWDQVVLKNGGSISGFYPETTLQIGGELSAIEHGMYPVEKGSKLAFDMPILLGCTWSCIL